MSRLSDYPVLKSADSKSQPSDVDPEQPTSILEIESVPQVHVQPTYPALQQPQIQVQTIPATQPVSTSNTTYPALTPAPAPSQKCFKNSKWIMQSIMLVLGFIALCFLSAALAVDDVMDIRYRYKWATNLGNNNHLDIPYRLGFFKYKKKMVSLSKLESAIPGFKKEDEFDIYSGLHMLFVYLMTYVTLGLTAIGVVLKAGGMAYQYLYNPEKPSKLFTAGVRFVSVIAISHVSEAIVLATMICTSKPIVEKEFRASAFLIGCSSITYIIYEVMACFI